MGVIPPNSLASSTAPFADAASRMWGAWTARLVAAGAVISCFGALNGWILLQGQLPLAAAMDGLMPRLLARRSPRGTPVPALVLSSVLVTAIVTTNYTKGLVGAFTFVILLATLSTLLPYAFSSVSLIRLLLRQRHHNPRQLGTGLVTAALALLYSGWAIVGAGRDAVFWGLLLLIAGLPVYVLVTRRADGERRRLIGSSTE
jgi:APA family basic amino acid/polyamine antiporter